MEGNPGRGVKDRSWDGGGAECLESIPIRP